MPTLTSSENKVGIMIQTTADTSGVRDTEKSMAGLTKSVVAGQAIYDILRGTMTKVVSGYKDSIAAANRYQSAMTGLSSIAEAFNQDQVAARNAAKELASDGLMTVNEAASGLKNLLASGFGLDQAIVLMDRFKDSAAFNRQAALGFGQAVVTATEGIKNGNSILVDNAGVTKNISVILKEAGKSQQDVMNVTSDASVRQALYNGLLRETAAMNGNASKLTKLYAGDQAKLSAVTETLRQRFGMVNQALSQGILGSMVKVLGGNQQMIVSMSFAAVTTGVLAFGFFKLIKMIDAFRLASIMAAVSNPLVMALTVLAAVAGVVVYRAMDKMQQKILDANDQAVQMSDVMGNDLPAAMGSTSDAAKDVADQIKKIDEQIVKATRDFKEQMATIVREHQSAVTDLKASIAEETAAFKEAQGERQKDYEDAQKEQLDEHQDKVDELQRQLDSQLALGKWADQEEVDSIKRKIAEENDAYNEQARKNKEAFLEETAAAKVEHQKRVDELDSRLQIEREFLTRHAGDVKATRNTILLDEIDQLRRSHREQLISLRDQKADIIKNAAETTGGVTQQWDKWAKAQESSGTYASTGSKLGKDFGVELKKAFTESIREIPSIFVDMIGDLMDAVSPGKTLEETLQEVEKSGKWREANSKLFDSSGSYTGYATGGDVKAGTPIMTGEEGRELFIPKQDGTIVNHPQTEKMFGGGSGKSIVINQTNHNYTEFDFDIAMRELGWRLQNA